MLKKQYNELLLRYNKGSEMLIKEPTNQEYLDGLNKIQEKLSEVVQKIPNMTEEQIINGFTQEEIDSEEKQMVLNQPKQQQIQQQSMPFDFKSNMELAKQLSTSVLVPDVYKNKPENILIAMSMGNRMGFDVFLIMQNLNIIKGKTGWSGSFCKTLIERSNKFFDLDLVYVGTEGKDDYGCYLEATRKSDCKRIQGPIVTIKMARAEGWTSNSKWINMPTLMLAYRCQSFFARLYVPEALNGIYTDDEVIEIDTNKVVPEDLLGD